MLSFQLVWAVELEVQVSTKVSFLTLHRYLSTDTIAAKMEQYPKNCSVAKTSFVYGTSLKGKNMWAAIFSSSIHPDDEKPLVKVRLSYMNKIRYAAIARSDTLL